MMMCLSMDFFEVIPSVLFFAFFFQLRGFITLCVLPNLGHFQPLLLQVLSQPHHLLSSLFGTLMIGMLDISLYFHRSLTIFFFFFFFSSLFPLCCPDWVISSVLSSSSLIFPLSPPFCPWTHLLGFLFQVVHVSVVLPCPPPKKPILQILISFTGLGHKGGGVDFDGGMMCDSELSEFYGTSKERLDGQQQHSMRLRIEKKVWQ